MVLSFPDGLSTPHEMRPLQTAQRPMQNQALSFRVKRGFCFFAGGRFLCERFFPSTSSGLTRPTGLSLSASRVVISTIIDVVGGLLKHLFEIRYA